MPKNLVPRLEPVDGARDHIAGPADAELTLVEYGSYACPHCRAASGAVDEVRERLGDNLRYIFRHRPLPGSDIARRAAELAERAAQVDRFWEAHAKLMKRSSSLTEEDLQVVADDLGLARLASEQNAESAREAAERVDEDVRSAAESDVVLSPSFFINGTLYRGPWDAHSLSEALLGTLGHQAWAASFEFVRWGPSAGLLLLLATVVALAVSNSPLGPSFAAFWEAHLSLTFNGSQFGLSLREWINEGLLTVFFLVLGLEIKREFTVGHLASARSAALPVVAALGGMVLPALVYAVIIPSGPWGQGWGIPMATDTAFALAVIAVLGRRVPVELRVFLTAAAVVDDIGAIGVIAIYYSADLQLYWLLAAAGSVAVLAMLNRGRIYRASPYLLVGIGLWACIYESGLHATLAGVLLALFIPTRPLPNFNALVAQASAVLNTDRNFAKEEGRRRVSVRALHAMDAIHDRLESPAARMLRLAGARSSYIILPLFALANAGFAFSVEVVQGREFLLAAIMGGLVIGKPLGIFLASWLAVRLRMAIKPDRYSWAQLGGAGAVAGIGFTMSLLVAGMALPTAADFGAAKIGIFAASLCSALIGAGLLWRFGSSSY